MNAIDSALQRPANPGSPPGTNHRATAVSAGTARVLRNTYALLALTLLFSAAVAATGAALAWPRLGVVPTLIGSFGLLYLTHKLSHSGWSLLSVFALTGFMGYTLGPVIAQALSVPGGSQIVTMALGTTAVTFFALSGYVLTTRKDFSFMGGFLFAGMVIALIGALGAVFLQIPALALTVSAAVVLLSVGLILFETSRIVHGGETNYVLATVGLYVSIFNLFTSLLSLFGFGGSAE
jgi:modulator of FtsH protease